MLPPEQSFVDFERIKYAVLRYRQDETNLWVDLAEAAAAEGPSVSYRVEDAQPILSIPLDDFEPHWRPLDTLSRKKRTRDYFPALRFREPQ
jgi:hypothetical protein